MSTVLIVDDRATNREIARAAIDLGGHHVIEACDGDEAIALTRSAHPDAVVVDVVMPGMDGYQFIHRLRSTPDTAGIPVLFYTANFTQDELAPMALTHGVSKIVLKSADPSELLDAVNEAIRDHPASISPPAGTTFVEHHGLTMSAKLVEKVLALDESDARFTAIAEVAPVGVVIGDPAGRATYVNPLLCDITRTPAADLLGDGWLRCLGADGRRDVRARLAQAPPDAPAHLDTLRSHAHITLANGDWRWLTVLVRLTHDSERIRTGFLAVIDDVTTVIDCESESRRLVTERFDSLARLAGGTAHGFNNLLHIILTHGEFAAESLAEGIGGVLTGAQAATIHNDLHQIRSAGQRAGHLAHQLLALGGREVVKPTVVDIDALVAEVHGMLTGTIGPHVEITTNGDAGPHHVLADESQLCQVLLDVAVNASDAMPSGGRLHIEVSHSGRPEDSSQAALAPGDYIHIAVTDNGHGMPSEVARHALEPFFTTKALGVGSGLGLATSYGVVKQAGGALTIQSSPGSGTTIHLYLPATDRGAVAQVRAEPAATSGGHTILVAEDEDGVREVVTRILRKAGFTVLAAVDGVDALATAERHDGHIDAVLTDVVMPRMDGRQLAEAFGHRWPGIPILYMSGFAGPLMTDQGFVAADVTVLGKPFTGAELVTALRSTLDRAAEERIG